MDALNTTMMVDRPDGPEQRRSKIIHAARWVSIDYRSIVANAVAGLADNTPDARRDVYAQARGVVHRHLRLMRLAEPIVELEKLALDLTIRKVERQARAAHAVPEEEEEPAEEATAPTVGVAVRSFGSALASFSIRSALPARIASATETSLLASFLCRILPSANTTWSSFAPASGDPAIFCASTRSSFCTARQAA